MNPSPGENAERRITSKARGAMAEAIAEAGGNEVFFAGSLDGKEQVDEVRVVARGSKGAVPAFLDAVGTREVVLHNHPSGNLEPSEADLSLASVFGHHGHGFYIVDNPVARVYVVVEPSLRRNVKKLDGDALAAVLGPGGALAQSLNDYESRPQQADMTRAVGHAFNHDGIAVIEAPTGVGKTLAYLVPAVEWALANKERVVVSTATINLQEQLIGKDIPLLQRSRPEPFAACLVKGRGNYVCHRKLQRALSEASLFEDKDEQTILQRIADWAGTTEDGSLSDLTFVPPRKLWEQVCSEADACSFGNCPAPGKCFVGKARREMAKADLLVVNHHMLFSDLAIKRETGRFSTLAVLPPYARVILDEAHNIEDAATAYFGLEVTRNGLVALLGRFIRNDRGRERGLIPYLKTKIFGEGGYLNPSDVDPILDLVDETILPVLALSRDKAVAAFAEIRHLASNLCKQTGNQIQWRLTEDVLLDPAMRRVHTTHVMPAVEQLQEAVSRLTELVVKLKNLPAPPDDREVPWMTELLQIDAYRLRLQSAAQGLSEGTSRALPENTVRWIEFDTQNHAIVRICRAPLEVAEPMAEWVFPNLRTLALTSATLAVGGEFDYTLCRLGLDRVTGRSVETVSLPSPFDFQSQALLCIPADIAAPDSAGFLEEVISHCREILTITGGHAFVLFTSFYALDRVHSRLEAELKAKGLTPLKQGQAGRTELLERFRAADSAVLFGTDSFWEGVDVAGPKLQCVILARLPFRVPTEPIHEARVEAIDATGGNAFMEYSVPQAVIKFRQGFGRLIRRKTDTGAVVVLDNRVVTKRYGRIFLESLPGVRVARGPRRAAYLALAAFFEQKGRKP